MKFNIYDSLPGNEAEDFQSESRKYRMLEGLRVGQKAVLDWADEVDAVNTPDKIASRISNYASKKAVELGIKLKTRNNKKKHKSLIERTS